MICYFLERALDLEYTSKKIGQELIDDGYYGVVGIDAIIGTDDFLYPCLEINARFNMSTYQNRILQEWTSAGSITLARPYPVHFTKRVPFIELYERLKSMLYFPGKESGIIINAFSTVNIVDKNGKTRPGKLYALLVGRTIEECYSLSEYLENILDGLKNDLDIV